MMSTTAASVVVLPEPFAPVATNSPLLRLQMSATGKGIPISVAVSRRAGITRRAICMPLSHM